MAVLLTALSAFLAWRWVDANLLHWGLEDKPEVTFDSNQLIRQVQAFELATVKQTYAGKATIEAPKELRAGPANVSLPGWAAGQKLDAKGTATVTAGVDLSKVGPNDMIVTRNGDDFIVTLRLPQPSILSTELTPGTLDLSTSEGVITRITKAAGLREEDLRDRAADQVLAGVREAAIEGGILLEAERETSERLTRFLQALPQPQDGRSRVTYQVVVAAPSEGPRQ